MTNDSHDWITAEDVRRKLGLKNRSTLDGWARAGKGPPFYRIETMRLYDRREVDAWLAACRVAPEAEADALTLILAELEQYAATSGTENEMYRRGLAFAIAALGGEVRPHATAVG